MLMLLIESGDESYAIEALAVIEVLPIISWRRLPKAPAGIPGAINHHGLPVPVLDLAEFVAHRSSKQSMATRIVVVEYGDDNGTSHPIGIIAERAAETIRLSDTDFVSSGVTLPDHPYLGPVALTPHGIIQKLDLRKLFPSDVRKHLFSALEDFVASAD